MREKVIEVLGEKTALMRKLRELLGEELKAVVAKDFESLNAIISKLEELSLELERVNGELEGVLRLHGEGVKLLDLLDVYGKDDEVVVTLSDFFKELNDLVFDVERLRGAIEFHLRYIDFLSGLGLKEILYQRDGTLRPESGNRFLGRS